MKTIIVLALLLSGCVTSYEPTTKEGAQCKMACSQGMQRCNASSYTCDKSYSLCVESCKSMEVAK